MYQSVHLCTVQFLLISNKFLVGGRVGSSAVMLLTFTSAVHSWALVHKTTCGPMIYTAPCVMLLMRAAFFTVTSGRVFGPGKLRLFWALLNGIEPIGECLLGPKKV
jgi:hypothetical protein